VGEQEIRKRKRSHMGSNGTLHWKESFYSDTIIQAIQ